MKFPTHIILDVSKDILNNTNQYWIFKYIFTFQKNKNLNLINLNAYKFFSLNKQKLILNKLINNQFKFTIQYNHNNPLIFLNNLEKNFYKNIYTNRLKVKHKVSESNFLEKKIYHFLTNTNKFYDEKIIKKLIRNFVFDAKYDVFKSNLLWSLFNINFLKKERIYTKLKYSRVPQYDIVSGGAAALLAGFLGFLITEKFGFELADSGDFYFLFMYLVFLFFFCRLFLKIMNNDKSSWNCFSLKWLFMFFKTLFILFINFIKNYWIK